MHRIIKMRKHGFTNLTSVIHHPEELNMYCTTEYCITPDLRVKFPMYCGPIQVVITTLGLENILPVKQKKHRQFAKFFVVEKTKAARLYLKFNPYYGWLYRWIIKKQLPGGPLHRAIFEYVLSANSEPHSNGFRSRIRGTM